MQAEAYSLLMQVTANKLGSVVLILFPSFAKSAMEIK